MAYPIGALIVEFLFMISISVAAGASAVITYLPGLASPPGGGHIRRVAQYRGPSG